MWHKSLLICLLVASGSLGEEPGLEVLESTLQEVQEGTGAFQDGTAVDDALARERARLIEKITTDCTDSKYRPIDNVCNNLKNPGWGTPLQSMRRLVKPAYDDGKGEPRFYGLPSARDVSVKCFQSDGPENEHPSLSMMLMQWGQFLDHDITGTPGTSASDCCKNMTAQGTHPDMKEGGNCFPIKVPDGDRKFTDCMEFTRSLAGTELAEGCTREQVNLLTPYIDAGMVYGLSKEETDELRTKSGGLMKTSESGARLPTSEKQPCKLQGGHACYWAGDFRVNEFPGLTAMHTLFVLEHNRLAKELETRNPAWEDEQLFQEARKIVIALVQHITMDKFLPAVLGKGFNKFLGGGFKYNESVDPGIFNSFATAAFRFGHSLIAGNFAVKGNPSAPIETLFFRPKFVAEGFEDVLQGVLNPPCQIFDSKFTTGVTDNLFKDLEKEGVSLDLGSLNIQRGRDHGLPSYMTFLKEMSKSLAPGDEVFTTNLKLPSCFLGIYNCVDDVDLFVGGAQEAPLRDAVVGPVFAYIIGTQFKNIRDGDRYWYETTDQNVGFTPDQLANIKKQTLGRIICDNIKGVTDIQQDVFRHHSQKVSCDSLDDLDLNLWPNEGPLAV